MPSSGRSSRSPRSGPSPAASSPRAPSNASAKVRLIREGREIYKGSIEALKRFKDDVKEVPQNFECGIKIGNFDDIKPDDVIEAYRIDVIRRTL